MTLRSISARPYLAHFILVEITASAAALPSSSARRPCSCVTPPASVSTRSLPLAPPSPSAPATVPAPTAPPPAASPTLPATAAAAASAPRYVHHPKTVSQRARAPRPGAPRPGASRGVHVVVAVILGTGLELLRVGTEMYLHVRLILQVYECVLLATLSHAFRISFLESKGQPMTGEHYLPVPTCALLSV
jgi:hypothetical protein